MRPQLSAGSPTTRTSSGSIRTPSKASSASVQPRRPIFLWVPATLTPSRARSTRTAPIPLPVPASLPGNRHQTRQATGPVAAGDVVLVGLEPVTVAVGGEPGPHGGGGRAGVGLGDPDAEELAGRGLRQPGRPHGLVAQVLDGPGRSVEDQLARGWRWRRRPGRSPPGRSPPRCHPCPCRRTPRHGHREELGPAPSALREASANSLVSSQREAFGGRYRARPRPGPASAERPGPRFRPARWRSVMRSPTEVPAPVAGGRRT